ncbi:hypothetical protein KIH74_31320 [Kineosporia sp. J2-2]|uniref:Uncharacterized protein n=1 Tax=Kineosporia corallincola TaxID=2835133 RepID=A0ABS5TRQ8_9ACTN|nr:hypothetical protein [Kineosporia corallincola]
MIPHHPGLESFAGLQMHTRDYVSADHLAGMRVAVVGGGISALQQLDEISRVADTFWYTRREPVFLDGEFRHEVEGRAVIARVTADVEAGRPTGSVVSYTGLLWTPCALTARERGALRLTGTRVTGEPRVHLIGFVPSQSTVGSNRAGRDAAAAVARQLGSVPAG